MSNYIESKNKPNVGVIIPNKIRNETKQDITKYTDILKFRYYLNNYYRVLTYDNNTNALRCSSSNGNLIIINDINRLINLRCRNRDNITFIIRSVNLINDKYTLELIKV